MGDKGLRIHKYIRQMRPCLLKKPLFLLVFIAQLLSCARGTIKTPEEALRAHSGMEQQNIHDTLDKATLQQSLEENIEHIKKQKKTFNFADRKVSSDDYTLALSQLLLFINDLSSLEDPEFSRYMVEHFDFYEVYGSDSWGEVFITGYFEPIIKGSKHKTKKYSQAIYATPKDMVLIKFDEFMKSFPQLRDLNAPDEQKTGYGVLRGRLVKEGDLPHIVPYYTREEIDTQYPLKRQKIEIAWVEPVDSFFLQIQGSGIIDFGKGRRIRVGYENQNGHPYEAIGKYLTDVIPLEEMSLQKIEAHLKTLSKEEIQSILNKNKSYVFFRILEDRAITSFGSHPVAGRTIATDWRLFPKGALAFLNVEEPQFTKDTEEVTWISRSRFVIDQDTGGAIRGPGRVDLYVGEGPDAKKVAGVMKHDGHLHYLAPKETWLNELKTLK